MTDGGWKFKLHVIMHAHAHTCMHTMHANMHAHTHPQVHTYAQVHVRVHTWIHTCMYIQNAHTCTFTSPAALEAYLPEGMRMGQVKANNPRKKM